jgi:acyl dehydratase
MMKHVSHFDTIETLVGKNLGASDWLTLDQKRIDTFAEATGDFQWIHVDPERAAREFSTGRTIAHGYLTLSLLSPLLKDILQIDGIAHSINYGSNRVRYTNMVPSGSRVRAHLSLKSVDQRSDGAKQLTNEVTIEIEGDSRPALVAETLRVIFPAK